MKNSIKIFGLIAIAAVITFTMTACGDNGSGKTVGIRLRASNNSGSVPSPSIARSIHTGDAVDTTSFKPYTDFYNTLGAVQASFTPTKFEMAGQIYFVSSDGNTLVVPADRFYDFASPQVFQITDVPVGVTLSAMIISLSDVIMDPQTHQPIKGKVEFPDNGAGISGENGFAWYLPGSAYTFINSTIDERKVDEDLIFYSLVYANNSKLKLYPLSGGNIPPQDIGLPAGTMVGPMKNQPIHPGIVVPSSPIYIPENASSVTFNISMDLNNIIQKYTVSSNDYYVLKNNWWTSLYISASVQ